MEIIYFLYVCALTNLPHTDFSFTIEEAGPIVEFQEKTSKTSKKTQREKKCQELSCQKYKILPQKLEDSTFLV